MGKVGKVVDRFLADTDVESGRLSFFMEFLTFRAKANRVEHCKRSVSQAQGRSGSCRSFPIENRSCRAGCCCGGANSSSKAPGPGTEGGRPLKMNLAGYFRYGETLFETR